MAVQIHRSRDVTNTSDKCLSNAVTLVIGMRLKDRMCRRVGSLLPRIREVWGSNLYSTRFLTDLVHVGLWP